MMASELATKLARLVELYGDRPVRRGLGATDSVLLYDVPGVIVISTEADAFTTTNY